MWQGATPCCQRHEHEQGQQQQQQQHRRHHPRGRPPLHLRAVFLRALLVPGRGLGLGLALARALGFLLGPGRALGLASPWAWAWARGAAGWVAPASLTAGTMREPCLKVTVVEACAWSGTASIRNLRRGSKAGGKAGWVRAKRQAAGCRRASAEARRAPPTCALHSPGPRHIPCAAHPHLHPAHQPTCTRTARPCTPHPHPHSPHPPTQGPPLHTTAPSTPTPCAHPHSPHPHPRPPHPPAHARPALAHHIPFHTHTLHTPIHSPIHTLHIHTRPPAHAGPVHAGLVLLAPHPVQALVHVLPRAARALELPAHAHRRAPEAAVAQREVGAAERLVLDLRRGGVVWCGVVWCGVVVEGLLAQRGQALIAHPSPPQPSSPSSPSSPIPPQRPHLLALLLPSLPSVPEAEPVVLVVRVAAAEHDGVRAALLLGAAKAGGRAVGGPREAPGLLQQQQQQQPFPTTSSSAAAACIRRCRLSNQQQQQRRGCLCTPLPSSPTSSSNTTATSIRRCRPFQPAAALPPTATGLNRRRSRRRRPT
jgi:hypothetical protein